MTKNAIPTNDFIPPAMVDGRMPEDQSLRKFSTSTARLLYLELKHGASAIERASMLARGTAVEADVARLLEAARATAELVKGDEPMVTMPASSPHATICTPADH